MKRHKRFHSLPLSLKRIASWEGITLLHYRLRPGQLLEHYQKHHLITMSLDGCKGELQMASGFRPGDRNKGSICIIPAGHRFSLTVEGESEHLAMLLAPSVVERAAAESNTTNNIEVLESSAPGDPVISSIGLALMGELESTTTDGNTYAASLASVLALHLIRHYAAPSHSNVRSIGGISRHKLRAVNAYIDENYSREITIAELAAVAGMSTFHFAREFKRATGTTPHQHLLKLRIDRAKQLLSQSEMSLADIGLQSGFSHQSHFSRLFRKLTGTTPLSYRLKFQN